MQEQMNKDLCFKFQNVIVIINRDSQPRTFRNGVFYKQKIRIVDFERVVTKSYEILSNDPIEESAKYSYDQYIYACQALESNKTEC